MRAMIWKKYGAPDNLQLQEVKTPTPNDDQILVKIHATSVTAGDCEIRRLQLPLGLSLPMRFYAGLFKPKRITILGQELSGEIVEVGKNVDNYQAGDQVFGTTGLSFGAYAEYIVLPSRPDDGQGALALKPASVPHEEAAVLPTAGLEALHYLRDSNIHAGDKVLIIGGGGSIGTMSIQLAKRHKAEVTAVDSTDKQALMRSLGADYIVDYTVTDYLKQKKRYDLIIDVVGRKGVRQRLKLLKPEGLYYLAFARPGELLLAIWISLTSKKKLIIQSASQKKEDLQSLAKLLVEGSLTPVIDKQFLLEEVSNAHKYAESGNKKGNIAISII